MISAIGAYINPRTAPDIPGLDTFAGPVQVPSRWQHDVDMRGKRVGIVGVGSSTVQIAPAIAGEVEHLDVYQRTRSGTSLNPTSGCRGHCSGCCRGAGSPMP